jgi:hypothetical protein
MSIETLVFFCIKDCGASAFNRSKRLGKNNNGLFDWLITISGAGAGGVTGREAPGGGKKGSTPRVFRDTPPTDEK